MFKAVDGLFILNENDLIHLNFPYLKPGVIFPIIIKKHLKITYLRIDMYNYALNKNEETFTRMSPGKNRSTYVSYHYYTHLTLNLFK